MFKFYIDGQLTDQPDSDTELVTTLRRDQELGGFLTTQEVTLTYSENKQLEAGRVSGYTLLKTAYDLGTCRQATLVVYDEQSATETYRVYTGVIKVPTMQVDEQYVRLSCKIEDNSYYAYIKNNKNVKFSLYATTTKNGEIITPPDVYSVDFFKSDTGIFNSVVGDYYNGYRVYDVLKFLVPAISDNKVTFESDFLRLTSPHLFLFDGTALRLPNTDPSVTTSFAELTTELGKLKNLQFYIDTTDPDSPVLRMEPQSWFFAGQGNMTFTEPLALKTSIKAEKLYGTILVGSKYNPGSATLGSPIYTWNKGQSYYGWKEESYLPYGQCNTEAELNLVNDFNIASNAINDSVNGGNTSQDDKLFIVECFDVDDSILTATAYYYSFPTTGLPYYYNLGLNNVQKLNRHGSSFQSALTNTQNGGTNVMHVSLGQDLTVVNFNNPGTGNPATTDPVEFTDELGGNNYDPGGNYDSVTNFWYLVPVAGDYSFASTINLELTGNHLDDSGTVFNPLDLTQAYVTQVALGIQFDVHIVAYEDLTLSTILFEQVGTLLTYTDSTYQVSAALVAQLPVGAVVRVYTVGEKRSFAPLVFGLTSLESIGWTYSGLFTGVPNGQDIIGIALEDSYFETNGTPEGAIVPAQPDQLLFKSKLLEFEYPLTTEQFRDILAFPLGSLEVIKDQVSRTGWIEELQHNHQSGQTKIKLITQDATT